MSAVPKPVQTGTISIVKEAGHAEGHASTRQQLFGFSLPTQDENIDGVQIGLAISAALYLSNPSTVVGMCCIAVSAVLVLLEHDNLRIQAAELILCLIVLVAWPLRYQNDISCYTLAALFLINASQLFVFPGLKWLHDGKKADHEAEHHEAHHS